MNFGFLRVGAAVPNLKVANAAYNSKKIIKLINAAEKEKVRIIVLPELSITAYTCGDLFFQQKLIGQALKGLNDILNNTVNKEIIAIVGLPIHIDGGLFNCAAIIQKGIILGVVPKVYIPNYSEFYEKRWFREGKFLITNEIILLGQKVPCGTDLLFENIADKNICFGIEICEDLWAAIPPSSYQVLNGASLVFNLSASNEIVGKSDYRRELVTQQSARGVCGYIYTSSGVDESTTDLVYGGHAIIAENGIVLKESERFCCKEQIIYTEIDIERLITSRYKNSSFINLESYKTYRKIYFKLPKIVINTLSRIIDKSPFVPDRKEIRDTRCHEIFSIQTNALSKRIRHTNINKAVIGISGGLDSTLALLVVSKTFEILNLDSKNIIAVTMPGFGTSKKTYQNAVSLMKLLNVTIREIDIKESCLRHFNDIGHDENIHDSTYENVQARERTQILMDIANKLNGLVIGTGDLSELALGWCTFNGDHMSMYGVNSSVPKTLVKYLVSWVADNADTSVKNVLRSIIETPISPELLPTSSLDEITQKTEDIIGPYEVHDFFLYNMIRHCFKPEKILFLASLAFEDKYSNEELRKFLKIFYKRFFSQQFKRSCLPDGPKVGSISLSPRGDFRMPSDADVEAFIKEL